MIYGPISDTVGLIESRSGFARDVGCPSYLTYFATLFRCCIGYLTKLSNFMPCINLYDSLVLNKPDLIDGNLFLDPISHCFHIT